MKIGLFTDQYYPIISGVVTSIKMLYEGLEAMGHEVYIVTFHVADKGLSEQQRKELEAKKIIHVRGVRYPFKAISDYRFALSYRKALKEIKALNLDIMHVQTEFSIAKLAMKASAKFNIPIIHTLHTSYKDYIQYLFPHLDKRYHKQIMHLEKKWFTGPISEASECEIVPTKKVIQDFELYGVADQKVEIIPTGIEIQRFQAKNANLEMINDIKRKYHILDTDFVFAYVGRTSKEKNIETLIEGFSLAFAGMHGVKFLLVGGGPELDGIKQVAEEYGVTDQMIFTGLVPWDEVPQYYHIANIFMNASKSETQGLTYIEALSSGTPVIVQKDDVIEDVVEDGKNGFVFDSVDELKEKMLEAYNNQEVLIEMKKNAIITSKRYSKERFAKSVYEIYKEVVENYKKKEK